MRERALNSWERVDTLRAHAGMGSDDVPPSAFTIAQYAAKYGLPYQTASGQLARLVELGRMKTGKKRTTLPSGRQGAMRFYWPA